MKIHVLHPGTKIEKDVEIDLENDTLNEMAQKACLTLGLNSYLKIKEQLKLYNDKKYVTDPYNAVREKDELEEGKLYILGLKNKAGYTDIDQQKDNKLMSFYMNQDEAADNFDKKLEQEDSDDDW